MVTFLADVLTTAAQKSACTKLGLTTVDEALRYLPRSYLYPGELTRIRDLVHDENAIVLGRVTGVSTVPMRKRGGKLTKVVLSDGYDSIELAFFNMPWLSRVLSKDKLVAVTGKVTFTRFGRQLAQPKILNLGDELHTESTTGHSTDGKSADGQSEVDFERELLGSQPAVLEEISKPIPAYRLKSGVSMNQVTKVIHRLLDTLPAEQFAETLPASVRERYGLLGYRMALNALHRPRDKDDITAGLDRFRFEEAFALQVEMLNRKILLGQETALPLTGRQQGFLDTFDAAQPFDLTASQQRAGTEISRDLIRSTPMNRLLHGDVGSGKTMVALRAMLQAVDSGTQAALLAPTEILATQHVGSLRALLGELASDGFSPGVRIEVLTGSMSARERKRVATELAAGIVDIVVGTHALLSDTTIFHQLGLVVIDEQHRFGVEQRERLREKGGGKVPHTLVMTATPIPRTVALTVYSDLDVSTLTDLPGGPKQVTSHVVALADHPTWLARVWEVVAEHLQLGHQAFVVASRIDPDTAGSDAEPRLLGVEELADRLRATPVLEGARIETLHGRSEPLVKDQAMQRFKNREFDILVATTVIEVGVDVHNARVMVIYDAHRFGIAQLHQLRGRVGRDGRPALCFFITPGSERDEATQRLKHVAGTMNGFELAEYDLETRREGDVLGTGQWGKARLRFISFEDEKLITVARTAAAEALAANPNLAHESALSDYLAFIMRTEEDV